MPLYDIRCSHCAHEEEIFRSLDEFDKPLPYHCFDEMRRVLRPLHIVGDIEPYRAVATDIATGAPPVITSRSQHREYLKRNDFVELGNDMPKHTPRAEPDTKEIGFQIKRVMDEKGIKA